MEVKTLTARIQKRLTGNEHDFSLDAVFFAPPGITILFGPSGAGKTTLLNCIAGLVTPDAGAIAIGDCTFFDGTRNLSPQHRNVGYVFQDLALFPHLSTEKNIGYGLGNVDREQGAQRVTGILEALGISHVRTNLPRNISGGERQRVALARALVTNPRILLLDEPLAALDGPTKSKIIEDLRAWNAAHRIPILYVTHSRDEVFALGERVLILEAGKITAEGTPHQVMDAPRQETVAQLAGFENLFDVTVLAAHEERGTMTCRIGETGVQLETPLVRSHAGLKLRVGIRAGDILLATTNPSGISARNLLPGRVVSLERRDVIVIAAVNCGVELKAHLTLAARDALELALGREVWLIVKTHSCHLMAAER